VVYTLRKALTVADSFAAAWEYFSAHAYENASQSQSAGLIFTTQFDSISCLL
jgi:hypothetical protein